MTGVAELESLNKLRLKLNLAKTIIEESNDIVRPSYVLNYLTIFYAIIGSIKVANTSPLKKTKQQHTNRYRRKKIREEREEDREWLMSDAPRSHWNTFTNEDWAPVRDQIRNLWHDINNLSCGSQPGVRKSVSSFIARELYKEGIN